MHKNYLIPLMLLLIGGLVWWAWSDSAPPLDPLRTPEPNRPGRDEVEIAPDFHRDPSVPRRRIVRGRCVDPRTREPIGGVAVELRGEPWFGEAKDIQVSTVQSDTDGRFEVGLVCSANHQVQISASAAGRAPVRGMVPDRGSAVDLGEVGLPIGVPLDVAVVDERFRLLAAVPVQLRRAREAGFRPAIDASQVLETKSDGDGALPRLLVEPGVWDVKILGGFFLVGPHQLDLRPGGSDRTTLMVRPGAREERIRGRVVDAGRRGLGGATVVARNRAGLVVGQATAGEDGAFDLLRDRASAVEAVTLEVSRVAGFESGASSGQVPWGAEGIVIELVRQHPVRITVVDRTNQPVEAFRLRWRRRTGGAGVDADRTAERGVTRAWEHPGGVLTLPLPAGELELVVVPLDQDLAPSPPQAVQHLGAGTARTVTLTRALTQTVEVVDGAGRPVPDARIEVLRPGAEPVTARSPARAPESWAESLGQPAPATLLWAATTDLDGRAQVRGAKEDGLAIRVQGATHLTVVRQPVDLASGVIQVVVERGASVVGAVRPADVLAALGHRSDASASAGGPRVVLTGPGGVVRQLSLDARGVFGCFGLAAGTYEVRFEAMRGGARFHQSWPEPVTFAAGEHRRLNFEIDGLEPAGLAGRLILDGKPAAGCRFELTRVDGGGGPSGKSLADGRFAVPQLQAGTYRFSILLTVPARPKPVRLVWSRRLELRPGEQLEQEIRIDRGVLRVRLTDHRGQPMGDTGLVLVAGEGAMRRACRTDPQGWVRLEPVAAGTYQVALRRPGSQGTAGRFGRWGIDTGELRTVGQVRVGPGSAEVQELRLPRDY